MIRTLRLLPFLLGLALPAQDLSDLPPWARNAAIQARDEKPPAAADAWVLLQRQEVAYLGAGAIRSRTFRLVKILNSRGLDEAWYVMHDLGGGATRSLSLKAWNLRPDGELVKLGRDDTVRVDADPQGAVTTSTLKYALVGRVVPGSIVAFQSEETYTRASGPCTLELPLEEHPVRRWELTSRAEPAGAEMRLDPRNWATWGLTPVPLPGGGLACDHLPALPANERLHPPLLSLMPSVLVRALDPGLRDMPSLATWDTFATYFAGRFRAGATPSGALAVKGLPPREALAKIVDWMNRQLTYQMAYLTPDRAWIPLPCPEVVRRRNGDCKDHASCLMGEAAGAGLEGYPVLCAIFDREAHPGGPPDPMAFNHAIAAIRLEASLGLPAEVETPRGRFLLLDTTDRYCPFGMLPADHRGRQVLICTPEGAQWAAVPAQACVVPRWNVDLRGGPDGKGGLTARIRIQETGNAFGLRAGAHRGGAAHLAERGLRGIFGLPATAVVSDVVLGDPLDLEKPFEATFTVTRPEVGPAPAGRVRLESWGLPDTLEAIQRPATRRKLPVELRNDLEYAYHAEWTLPGSATASLPALEGSSPFGDLKWTARAADDKAALDLTIVHRDAHFDGDARDAGVAAWKAYRSLVNQVLEEGVEFRTAAATAP